MTAPWPLLPLGNALDQCRWICWEFEGAKFGHRVVHNPHDPGGRTLSGLTLATYSRDYLRLPAPTLAPIAEFDALTLDAVVDVILALFAMRTGIGLIGDPSVRLAVLDFAIHAGADDAVPALQRAVGADPDGRIGRLTLAALERATPTRVCAVIAAARYEKAARRVIVAPQQAVPFLLGWFERFSRVLLAVTLVALLLIAPAHAQERALPDPALTPGQTRLLSLDTICTTKWGLDRRLVTDAMKRHVLAAYGLTWDDRSRVEIDHLVPRSLGGADDILNLWPQPWSGEWGARRKDRLELALGRRVCAGQMTLGAAQLAIRTDWIATYQSVVGDK